MRVVPLIAIVLLSLAEIASGQQFQLAPRETTFASFEPSPITANQLGNDYFELDSNYDPRNQTSRNLIAVTSFRPAYASSQFNDPMYQFDLKYEVENDESFLSGVSLELNQFGSNVVGDYKSFYTARNMKLLGGAFLIGGITANTPYDYTLREKFQENLLYTPSDDYAEFLHQNRYLGDGFFLLPAYAIVTVAGKYLIDDPRAYVVGDWSERTIRGILVGAPPLLITQLATGGSRPNETGHGSDWRPFKDDNGVSGHAFMGAVPLLTAARMSKNRWAKGAFIAASVLPGLSRITDDVHYPSQVFLGWTLAWVATSAVNDTQQRSTRNLAIAPTMIDNSPGIGITLTR